MQLHFDSTSDYLSYGYLLENKLLNNDLAIYLFRRGIKSLEINILNIFVNDLRYDNLNHMGHQLLIGILVDIIKIEKSFVCNCGSKISLNFRIDPSIYLFSVDFQM